MDRDALNNSSSSSVGSVGSAIASSARPPACWCSCLSLCCCRRLQRTCRARQHLPPGPPRTARLERVPAPGAEKEIPICYAGPTQQVTVVAASQARMVSKGLVRYGAVRCGAARRAPVPQGVALSRIQGTS